jgi:hypothetical protein
LFIRWGRLEEALLTFVKSYFQISVETGAVKAAAGIDTVDSSAIPAFNPW